MKPAELLRTITAGADVEAYLAQQRAWLEAELRGIREDLARVDLDAVKAAAPTIRRLLRNA